MVTPVQFVQDFNQGKLTTKRGTFLAMHSKPGESIFDPTYDMPHRPKWICLCCSDARDSPELVLQDKTTGKPLAIGEGFVVRTAGQTLGSSVTGSIEYAVKHLEVKELYIMGHTGCGAVEAAMKPPDSTNNELGPMMNLVAEVRSRIRGLVQRLATSTKYTPDKKWERCVHENVKMTFSDLMKESRFLRAKVISQQLKVYTGVFDIKRHSGGSPDMMTAVQHMHDNGSPKRVTQPRQSATSTRPKTKDKRKTLWAEAFKPQTTQTTTIRPRKPPATPRKWQP
jgi:carbonic anhydrase